MNVKLLEIRDRATFIPCFAFRPSEAGCQDVGPMGNWNGQRVESLLARRTGYGNGNPVVIFGSLNDPSRCQNDPFAWADGSRTMPEAHRWIERNWHSIQSGDVIDVEFILGETKTKKISEAFEHPNPGDPAETV